MPTKLKRSYRFALRSSITIALTAAFFLFCLQKYFNTLNFYILVIVALFLFGFSFVVL